jgi:hypothetical protein
MSFSAALPSKKSGGEEEGKEENFFHDFGTLLCKPNQIYHSTFSRLRFLPFQNETESAN